MQNKIIIVLKKFLIDLFKKMQENYRPYQNFQKIQYVNLFILIKYELSNFSKIRIIIKDTRFIKKSRTLNSFS